MKNCIDPMVSDLAASDRRRLYQAREKVVDISLDGPAIPRFPEVTLDMRADGLRFILLPPGETTVNYKTEISFIDVNLNPGSHLVSWNSDRLSEEYFPTDSFAFVPCGTEFRISTANALPGLILEIEPSYWPDSLREDLGFADGASGFGGDGASRRSVDFLTYEHDPVAAELGRAGMRLLIEDHRLGERADALALEGIALGLIGRVVKRLDDDRSAPRRTPIPSALASRKMRVVTEYIEANLHETILVADLAQLVAMSASHFARSFTLTMGVSPARYVVTRRVARANLMLTQAELSIAQIAFVCGFSGQAHLTRVFRKVAGVTPGEFRRGDG